jgi:hypothetical protein
MSEITDKELMWDLLNGVKQTIVGYGPNAFKQTLIAVKVTNEWYTIIPGEGTKQSKIIAIDRKKREITWLVKNE